MSNVNVCNGLRLALATFSMLAIAACTSTISDVDKKGRTSSPVFPVMVDATRPDGSYVNLENLGKIANGMTKAQLRELIGPPQFSEGMFGVREWDYILKFRQPNGAPDKVCQYKVLFDDDMIARSFYFLPQDCMQANSEANHEVAPAADKVEQVTLSADATFAFGSTELLPRGRAALSELAKHLESREVASINIVGHTDRIGSSSRNMELSRKRAAAVRTYLIGQDIPADIISFDGHGAAEPLVECPGARSAAVVDCLAPNRRATVTIVSR
ncbi:SmpA/OmlA domain-containing protein [Pseudomonas sp. ATCC 13867]|uniref:OmpA family protein n=1 Tax=Pseudomonas sp. ATCC 13867 TaxID=1294143 RepID=UPI0002C4E33E|nr:OmpA family protein [Pseudomonas sp. ATCC 13867]AGI24576.1 SmpA/OmlA domain-containing protein [Pseudomonas sp. ATCC 13867]RFQ28063.1 outer membrane protein assembly factor BamE [Pseudomonas sp. ATCC 13867]